MTHRYLRRPTPPEPAPYGLSLGRVFGVPVRMDWSLALVFLLIASDLAVAVFPAWHPEWGMFACWAMSLGAAALFIGSLLAHELSHALVGRWQGVPVRQITLFLFGGMAHMNGRPETPKKEALIAVVGPLTSFAIGALATLAGFALAGDALSGAWTENPEAALAAIGPGATLLLWLGPMNLALGAFNLVPGFPLDGGRVLRAALWAALDDLRRATLWASRVGKTFALALMGVGVASLLGGAWAQGLWLLLIGWFLLRAAGGAYEQVLLREALERVALETLMRRDLPAVEITARLDSMMQRFLHTDDSAVVVQDAEGWFAGIVTLEDVQEVPIDEWSETTVGAVMTPEADLPRLPADASAEVAFERLVTEDVMQIGVTRGEQIVGVIERRDLLRWLEVQPELASA